METKIKHSRIWLIVKIILFTCMSELIWILGRNFSTISTSVNGIKSALYFFGGHIGIRSLLAFLVIYILAFGSIYFFGSKVYDFIYEYRYLIAISILIVCVVLNLSGSSIGCYGNYISSIDSDSGVLFGCNRYIRGDEWATNTPMALSQQFTGFSYFSDIIRGGDSTDTFIIYGQPVWSLAEIFRPFHWGYLILGVERGLSFFWCARLIATFMVSFEFARVILKCKNKFCIMYGVFIAFSPLLQWWFAINGLAEILIFGQLIVIMVDKYITAQSYRIKILCAVVVFISAGGYVLCFYPAWQVPFFYAFVALVISVIVKNRKNIVWDWKKDTFIVLGLVVLLSVNLLLIIIKSWDTIQTTLNTVFPGSRSECGGGSIKQLFTYPSNLFFPFDDSVTPNTCEVSAFFSFFPLGSILAIITMIKNKKVDSTLIALLIVNILLILFCTVGYPEFLAKITLLSNSLTGRTVVAIGLIDFMLLMRSCVLIRSKINLIFAVALSLLFALAVSFICHSLFQDYMSMTKIIISATFLFLGCLLFLAPHTVFSKSFIIPILTIVIAVVGILVNPIRTGLSTIYESDVYQDISEVVSSDKEAKWIVDDLGYPMMNIPIIAGASTINSTNVYPNMDRWELLDPDKEYSSIYNRYSHIVIRLITSEETNFKLLSPDYICINLNVNDVEKLGITYILTDRNLTEYSNDDVQFNLLKSVDENLKIFKVSYD